MGTDDQKRRRSHDPREGETRYPPEESPQYTGSHDERDPHERLNARLDELEEGMPKGPNPDTRPTGNMGRPESGPSESHRT